MSELLLPFRHFDHPNHRSRLRPNLRKIKSALSSPNFTNCLVFDKSMWSSKLKSLRWATVVLGILNLGSVGLGATLVVSASSGCGGGVLTGFVFVSAVSAVRIMSMIGIGIAQEATATTILNSPKDSAAAIRHERRMKYKRWLWWTRFGVIITVLQFLGAMYLVFVMLKYLSHDGKSNGCFSGPNMIGDGWKNLLVIFVILVWILVIGQCLIGSDVLKWRSFYATHDNAWKTHYQEVFDHGIREFLCCLGRVKYLSALEEDEINSVARLLGDLVAYRASGTGHLELLAGLALLQRHKHSKNSDEDLTEAPESQIQEAVIFHPFAEAAYTGPLLDFGRNPILFPCAWLYRQGVLTPWARHRRPILQGDNWWRGHAAAFLKYAKVSPEALLRGRVCQAKCEAAYFVVVLHHLKSVVIAVRGTETPEDLITDGLCRECTLSSEDLDGLISSDNVHPNVRQSIISSFPHYGHSGIVEAARELFIQIDGSPCDNVLKTPLGSFPRCWVMDVSVMDTMLRIVGHSLGGAIGSLLGIRLYRRYPNLHVYAYGPLPCVDSVVAEACSSFVTSIVYNDEFSARLSVNSITRLRAAAITALSQDSTADSAMIWRLAQRVLQISKFYWNKEDGRPAPRLQSGAETTEGACDQRYGKKNYKYALIGGVFLCVHVVFCVVNMPNYRHGYRVRNKNIKFTSDVSIERKSVSNQRSSAFTAGDDEQHQSFPSTVVVDIVNPSHNPDTSSILSEPCFDVKADVIVSSCEDPVSEFMDHVPSSSGASAGDPPEMFLPGIVIHIVPEQRSSHSLWKSWRLNDGLGYKAYIAKREDFKDITVSPYMFLDHLPWRVHRAMQKVLETRHFSVQHPDSLVV
ncbi:hypothetical protein Scep_011039 [Stephania cephalantha]|uniref:Fungal lipase-like domain-containing protein n=1 Tax=Stephania cephalantha TaxID=152367 RepID=A0AAP0JW98_9MAGN